MTLALVGPNPATPASTKGTLRVPFVLAGMLRLRRAFALVANASVRIRRPKLCKPACKAQGVRIFAKDEYPVSSIDCYAEETEKITRFLPFFLP